MTAPPGRDWARGQPKITAAYIELGMGAVMAGAPRAATGRFPYQHRTCAEWAPT